MEGKWEGRERRKEQVPGSIIVLYIPAEFYFVNEFWWGRN